MANFIVMPKMGFDMREGELSQWLFEIGSQVNKGDIVAEIESDKATLELESQATGILLAILAHSGDIVAVGENVAIVGEAGEDVSALIGAASDPVPAEAAPAAEASTPAPAVAAAPTGEVAGTASSEFPAGVKATPVARRIATENNVNLLQVPFEGERIRKADVEAFISSGGAVAPVAPAPAIQATLATAGETDTAVPTTRLRQAIARRMVESKTTVPHFQVTMEIDMAPAMALRKQVNGMLEAEGIKVSVNDILVKAAGVALRDFPNINASFGGDEMILHNEINVGSAVATEKGLLVVVQKNTDKSPLSIVAQQNKEMIGRAREGKVHPDDVSGGTFSISNLGIYGVDQFTAIINPPEAAILAIGGIHQVPVVVDGELTIGTRMKATVSADHRVTDGAEAAEFMVRFKQLLENPMRLLV
ncbi:MAG: pyruvate dehydrogenase E2 component (dihydrolipoamide acetyltransferase) [Cellvibrionaceae bacterium]|jgi:pyruvate dehydrogenase E2 component (dihydrolipoamide acetyltransferase)